MVISLFYVRSYAISVLGGPLLRIFTIPKKSQVVVVFVVTVPENEFTVPKSITKFLTHQVITDTIETVSCGMCKLLEKLLEDSMHT
jgi:hypothetical protein